MKKYKPFTLPELEEIAERPLTQEIAERWEEYLAVRSEVAKTRISTKPSEKRIFKQLLKMGDNTKILFHLVQSIDYRWRGFFPLKGPYLDDYKKSKPPVQTQPPPQPGFEPKKPNVRAYIEKHAKEGKDWAIKALRKLENPNLAKAERAAKEQEMKERLKKTVQNDSYDGPGFAKI